LLQNALEESIFAVLSADRAGDASIRVSWPADSSKPAVDAPDSLA